MYVREIDRLWTLEELTQKVSAKSMPLRLRIVPGRGEILTDIDALGTARTSAATRRQVANRRENG